MPISKELLQSIEHYLDHSATAEEIQQVNEWYHSFDDTELVITTNEKDLKHKIDVMIRSRLAESTGVKAIYQTPAPKLYPKTLIKWAAALLIISGAALYTYQANKTNVQETIQSGKNIARLTLANGRQIILSDAAEGQLAEESGVSIHKTSEGQIIYTIANQKEGNNSQPGMNTIETPNGGKYQVNLPDGTRIWLNAASTLRYPSRFIGNERKVELNGEAYFEVAKVMLNGSKTHRMPFLVKTNQQTVEVLGTHFNVNSYQEDAIVKTTLLEGSVKVTPASGKNSQLLKPGQQSVLETGELNVKEADMASEMAWRNGEFSFTSHDFRAEMRKVARWYDVEIIYDASAPQDFELGGFVSRTKDISAILELIELTGKVHFKVKGRRILVTK